MPADQPNRAWKHSAAPGGAAKAGKRAWQKMPDAPAAGPKKPWSRKAKLGLATFTVSAVIGLMILIILILRPAKPAGLVLFGAAFEEELSVPQNVYGWQGLLDLATLQNAGGVASWMPWSGSRPIHVLSEPKEEYNPKDGSIPKSLSEETLVLFLALHGGSNKNGAYLVVKGQKGPENIPVKNILETLRTSPQLQGKKKVLILDPTQVLAHWPSGLLYNDFVRKLKELTQEIEKIDSLVVLCASDEGQRSWVSEEWRQTIFTHYVLEGLRGAADVVENGGNGNSRVTAKELYRYVKKRVEAWAQINREAVQTPLLLGGEERADGIELVQSSEPYTEAPPDKAPGREFKVSDKLKTAWADCSRLRKQVPAPEVYTPQTWRRYQDTLLRFEQVLRAGDPTRKADNLHASLTSLGNRIVTGRALAGVSTSLTYTLPMHAEAGRNGHWAAEQRKELATKFAALWDIGLTEERQKAWESLRDWATGLPETKDDATGGKLLQMELTQLLLEQVAAAPENPPDLKKADELLTLIGGLNAPRPTEAQYLRLLKLDLDPRAKPVPPGKKTAKSKNEPPLPASPLTLGSYSEGIRQALQVTLLAERTAAGIGARQAGSERGPIHPYSETLLPWIDETVKGADEQRRKGVDYLFGPSSAWAKAGAAFTKAATTYQLAGLDAERVRQGLEVRDRVMADLPYLATWAAARRSAATSGRDAVEANDLLKGIEELARSMNDLTPLLDYDASTKGSDRTKRIGDLAEELSKNLQGLRDKYTQSGEQLAKQVVDQVHYLPAFEAVLSVPLIEDASLRTTLLGKTRSLTARFHERPLNLATVNVKGPGEAAQAAQALETARGQALMAVAVTRLAKHWLETGNVDQMTTLVGRLPPGAQWHEDVARVGEDIAGRYEEMRQRTASGWKKSIDAKKLDVAAAKVQVPESLCRLIPGGAAPVPPMEAIDQAVDASRKLRFHNLLLWQAQRTLDDHWFMGSDSPKDTYYGPAATACVKDAASLVESGDEIINKERQQKARELQDKVVYAGIESKPRPSQDVISSRDSVAWKLETVGTLPPGSMPAFWLDVTGPVKPLDPAELERKTLEAVPPKLSFPVQKVAVAKPKDATPAAEDEEAHAFLHGRFRGQRIEQTTLLKLHKEPEIHVFRLPPPQSAGLSLRMAPGFTYGAVSIVLDCSGSMGWDINGNEKPKKDQAKIDWARKSLEQVLNKLPDGTWLSIFTFGQKKPSSEIYLVRRPERWNRGAATTGINALMEDIKNLQPWSYSPIAKAIGKAKAEGFPADSQGAKVILVLTDGDDNQYEEEFLTKVADAKDKKRQRAELINKFLQKQFNGGEIDLRIVCFAKKDSEDAQGAEDQFGVIKNFEPPGQFLVEQRPANLGKTLEKALRPRLRLKRGERFVPMFADRKPVDELIATPSDKDLEWQQIKPPDLYRATIQRIYGQDLLLDPGQLLNITLVQRDSQVFFRRGLLHDMAKKKISTETRGQWYVQSGPWYVSVVQNQLTRPYDGLRQLIALETTQEVEAKKVSDESLHQSKPAFLWMELNAPAKTPHIHWEDAYGYPAATFLLEAPEWPRPDGNTARPDLKVWWSEHVPAGLPITHETGQPLESLQKQYTLESGGRFTIRKIGVDTDRPLPKGMEGAKTQTPRPCLVVEVEHDPGKPVWLVADRKLGFRGEEHLFYTSANMYTAVFYGVVNTDVEFTLTAISLNEFKKSSAMNRHAPFNLNPPEPGDGVPVLRNEDILK